MMLPVCATCVCATTTKSATTKSTSTTTTFTSITSTTTTACELYTGDSCGDNRADNGIIITHVVMLGGDNR